MRLSKYLRLSLLLISCVYHGLAVASETDSTFHRQQHGPVTYFQPGEPWPGFYTSYTGIAENAFVNGFTHFMQGVKPGFCRPSTKKDIKKSFAKVGINLRPDDYPSIGIEDLNEDGFCDYLYLIPRSSTAEAPDPLFSILVRGRNGKLSEVIRFRSNAYQLRLTPYNGFVQIEGLIGGGSNLVRSLYRFNGTSYDLVRKYRYSCQRAGTRDQCRFQDDLLSN